MNVMNLPINNVIVLLVIGVGLLVMLIVMGSLFQKAFIGWRTPTTWISALPGNGWVEVLGKIRGEPVKSPYGKLDCGYWQIEVQEFQNRGRGGGSWRTIYKSSSGSFMLDDMTGRIQVLDGKANMVTNNQILVDNSDPAAVSFIEGLGIKTTGLFGFRKRMRLYERVVMPEEDLLVLGKLQKSTSPVTIAGNDIVPMVISNLGRNETNKALLWQTAKPVLISLLVVGGVLAFFIFANSQ